MEVCNHMSMIKIDQRLQELEAMHSAKDGGEKGSDSEGTATGQHSEVQSSVQRFQPFRGKCRSFRRS